MRIRLTVGCLIMFDWINFLQRRGIAFATRGKNVAKGNLVGFPLCPFCGPEDEGYSHGNFHQGTGVEIMFARVVAVNIGVQRTR